MGGKKTSSLMLQDQCSGKSPASDMNERIDVPDVRLGDTISNGSNSAVEMHSTSSANSSGRIQRMAADEDTLDVPQLGQTNGSGITPKQRQSNKTNADYIASV